MSELWELPKSWIWVKVGDVADVVGGGTPPTGNPSNFDGEVPWITPADLSGYKEKYIRAGARNITQQGYDNSGARWLPQGSVLFSSRAPIGYVAIAACAVTTNQGFKSFVLPQGVGSDFLYYWLSSAKQYAEALASGTTFMEISGAKAALIPFPLAPAAEQVRIVTKLEELLSDLDAGVAELKAAQKKLQQYRQSLLKVAVEGELTASWRKEQRKLGIPTETGAQLHARILTERRARWEAKQLAKFKEQGKTPPKDWQKKYPEPVQPDKGALPTLPKGWVWASLDQLVSESSYGTSAKCSYEAKGIPVLRIPNVSDGRLDLQDMKFSTIDLGLKRDEPLAVGDLLVIRTNGSISLVGRAAAVIDVLPIDHYFASYLLRLRCVEVSCVHLWLLAILSGQAGRQWLEARAASSAGQHNISLSTLLTMPIPLPPLVEQTVALANLEVNRTSIKLQEAAAELSLKQSIAQRQNILRAAFAGHLVPQDPSDEPASVLLERIRAERAEHAKQPKARKSKQQKEIAAVVSKLIDVLAEAGDWVPAQEAFRRCGVTNGALTDRIEELYAELRRLDKEGRLACEPVLGLDKKSGKKVKMGDRLKLVVG